MKITIISLISFAAVVSALPTTSVNMPAIRVRSEESIRSDDNPVQLNGNLVKGDDGADNYEVKWSKEKRGDDTADGYL
jgi:hypothetical protein